MEKEKKISFIIGAVLLLLIAAGTVIILMFKNTARGKLVWDTMGLIGGVFQFIVGIILFRGVRRPYLKALSFFVTVMGIGIIVVHLFRMASL